MVKLSSSNTIISKIFPLIILILPLLDVYAKHDHIEPTLNKDYYVKACPRFDDIVNKHVTSKQTEKPTTAAAVVRIFFHDCMIDGCDGSTLVASNSFNPKAERDADINLSLPGDAFDLVTRIKTDLELHCPGIVSCTDILAISARNLVKMTGGPFYEVKLGRRDGLISQASRVPGNLALPNMTITQIIDQFKNKNFTIEEMVALVGAHTIGFSHCKEFSNRIFNYGKNQAIDPKMNPTYAQGLRKLCANYTKDPTMAAFNDVMTPGKFDNMYYRNLQRGLGLLGTDQGMYEDPRTKPIVDRYAANETAFFDDFSKAMEKVSMFKILTGKDGEVRHRCDQFNNIKEARN